MTFKHKLGNPNCEFNILQTNEHEEVINSLQATMICGEVIKNHQYYHKAEGRLVSFDGVTKVAIVKDSIIMATRTNVLSFIIDFLQQRRDENIKYMSNSKKNYYVRNNLACFVLKLV